VDEATRGDILVCVRGILIEVAQLERTLRDVRWQVESLQLVLETPTVSEIDAKEQRHDDQGIERA